MKLYNTLTKKLEEVAPIDNNPNNEIGFYSCGPTVYDFTHLGHLRHYTMDDVLVRTLRRNGFRVKHVENITDVGHLTSDSDTGQDKLEKGAKKYKITVWDLAHKFENFFWHSMDLMGNVKPDVSCRATGHIKEQLEMVKILEAKGFTYIIEGDGVYFDTSKLADYGKLARLNIKQLREGARIGAVVGKKNLTDFALWKFEKEGESRAMVWPSPWHKRSFPGWHIECSAMSITYLGEQFEIHTGGIDHIPVHHTNEIAQAEAATGKKPFVKIWVHHSFLQIEGEKMSKSLGNFFTIDDVIERGFDPMALRLLFLSAHYRGELNFTWDNLAGTQKAWEKLNRFIQYILKSPKFNQDLSASKSAEAKKYSEQFFANINNDLDTVQALATMWEMIKDESLSEEERYLLLLEFDQVLGLGLEHIKLESKIPSEVQALLDERQKARQERDWSKSDELRGKIAELGFRVLDRELEQVVEKQL